MDKGVGVIVNIIKNNKLVKISIHYYRVHTIFKSKEIHTPPCRKQYKFPIKYIKST